MFYGDVGTTYYIDDIKIVRTDSYTPTTTYQYTVETEIIELPYAAKAGYTFLGWNTKADGTGTKVTTYGGGEVGNKTYYAIYKITNPTATTSANTTTVTYNSNSATLTATINNEGLTVASSYQWHVSTTKGFTPSDSTKIDNATSATYIHEPTSRDVGTYYYVCVVKTSDDGKEIASTSTAITVVKGTPSATITMEGYTYAGTLANPSTTQNLSEGTITYYYNTQNSTTGGTEWKNMTSTTLNVGTYYMYATIAETTNYNAGVSNVVEFAVCCCIYLTC